MEKQNGGGDSGEGVLVSESCDIFSSDVLAILQNAYLHEESKQAFTYKSALLIQNPDLEEQYQAFRAKRRDVGYSEEELRESYGFLLFDDVNEANRLGDTGVLTGSGTLSTLGDPSKGVYISKYSDCLDPNHWSLKSGYIAILRLTKGRVQRVSENYTQNYTAPSVGFDCHISEKLSGVTAATSSYFAFNTSQYYMYELLHDGSNETAPSPGHVCPFAIVAFSYGGTKSTPTEPQKTRPAVVKADKPISMLDLRQLVPKDLFEINFTGEAFLEGLYCSLCELVPSKADDTSLSLLTQELKEKDLALVIQLNNSGFLILLHSSHFLQYSGTEVLQGVFVFPDSHAVQRDAKGGWKKPTISSQILQVLPAFSYAASEVEKMAPDQREELYGLLAKNIKNYATLINPEWAASPSREDGAPDQYDVPDHALKYLYSAPKVTNRACQSFRSYVNQPGHFQLPVSRVVELLAEGEEEPRRCLYDEVYSCLSIQPDSPARTESEGQLDNQESPARTESEGQLDHQESPARTESEGQLDHQESPARMESEGQLDNQESPAHAETAVDSHIAKEAQVDKTIVPLNEVPCSLQAGDTTIDIKKPGLLVPTETTHLPSGDLPSGDLPSGDLPAGDLPAGDLPSGDLPAGDLPSGDLPAGDLPSGDLPAGDLPSGDLPSGDLPSGDLPSGDLPSGDLPAGDLPSGDLPAGDLPSGDLPSGDLPSGDLPAGDLPSGDLPAGDLPSGDLPSGDLPSGDLPSGDLPSGDLPAGDLPSGDLPAGDLPSGDLPSGDLPSGDLPAGDLPSGDLPAGDLPSGDLPSGDLPSGDLPAGDLPAGDLPAGDLPSGDLPSGDLPAGDLPAGDLPAGDLPAGDLPSGDLPAGDLPSGDLPSGDLPAGDLPSGDLPSGDLPSGDLPSGDLPTDSIVSVASEEGTVIDGSLEPLSPDWRRLPRRSRKGKLFLKKKRARSAAVKVNESIVTDEAYSVRRKTERWDLKPIITQCRRILVPYGYIDVDNQLKHLKDKQKATEVVSHMNLPETGGTDSLPPAVVQRHTDIPSVLTKLTVLIRGKRKAMSNESSNGVLDTNTGTEEVSRALSIDPEFAQALGLTPTQSPAKRQRTEHQDTISDSQPQPIPKPSPILEKGRRKSVDMSPEYIKKKWWLHFHSAPSFASEKLKYKVCRINSVRKSLKGNMHSCCSTDDLTLLADLALSASSGQPEPALERKLDSSLEMCDFTKDATGAEQESVPHALLKPPAASPVLPLTSPSPQGLVVGSKDLVVLISKEHAYSFPPSSCLLLGLPGTPFQVSPVSGSAGLRQRHQNTYGNGIQALHAFLCQEGKSGHKREGPEDPKKVPRRRKFGNSRSIVEKEGSIQVTRQWKENYDFHLDSKSTDVPMDKTVIRALHGPWDFTIQDTHEDMQLILHMWIGLFYSRSTQRFFHTSEESEDLEMPSGTVPEPTQSQTKATSPTPLTTADTSTADTSVSKALDLSRKDVPVLPHGSVVLDLSLRNPHVEVVPSDPHVCRKEVAVSRKQVEAIESSPALRLLTGLPEANTYVPQAEQSYRESLSPLCEAMADVCLGMMAKTDIEEEAITKCNGKVTLAERPSQVYGENHACSDSLLRMQCVNGNTLTREDITSIQSQVPHVPLDRPSLMEHIDDESVAEATSEKAGNLSTYEVHSEKVGLPVTVESGPAIPQTEHGTVRERHNEAETGFSELSSGDAEDQDNISTEGERKVDNTTQKDNVSKMEKDQIGIPVVRGAEDRKDERSENIHDPVTIPFIGIASRHDTLNPPVLNPQDEVQVLNPQDKVQVLNPQDKVQVLNPQDKVQVLNPQDKVQVLNPQDKVQVLNPQDKVQVLNPQDKVQVLNPQDEVQDQKETPFITEKDYHEGISHTEVDNKSPERGEKTLLLADVDHSESQQPTAYNEGEFHDRCPTPTVDETPYEYIACPNPCSRTSDSSDQVCKKLSGHSTPTHDELPPEQELCYKSSVGSDPDLHHDPSLGKVHSDVELRTLRVLNSIDKNLFKSHPKPRQGDLPEDPSSARIKGEKINGMNPVVYMQPRETNSAVPEHCSKRADDLQDRSLGQYSAYPHRTSASTDCLQTAHPNIDQDGHKATSEYNLGHEPHPHSLLQPPIMAGKPSMSQEGQTFTSVISGSPGNNDPDFNSNTAKCAHVDAFYPCQGSEILNVSELPSWSSMQATESGKRSTRVDDKNEDWLKHCLVEKNGQTTDEGMEIDGEDHYAAGLDYNENEMTDDDGFSLGPSTSSLRCTVYNSGRKRSKSLVEVSQSLQSDLTQTSVEQDHLIFSEQMKQLLKRSRRGPSYKGQANYSRSRCSCTSPMTVHFSSLEEQEDSVDRLEVLPSLIGQKIKVDMPERSGLADTAEEENTMHLQKLSYGKGEPVAHAEVSHVAAECVRSYRAMMDDVCAGKNLPAKPQSSKVDRGSSKSDPSTHADLSGQVKRVMCESLHSNLNSVVRQSCKTKFRFYILVTSDHPFFDETKVQLEAEGHTGVQPEQFFLSTESSSLLIILRNEDIADHICEVPHLLELKKSPAVLFAGIDKPDDIVNLTHQELFNKGGFLMFERAALDGLSLRNMKTMSHFLEELSKNGKWKWMLHYKDSRRLKENAWRSAEAMEKKNFMSYCQEAGIVELLPYHECDLMSRDQPNYLNCLLCLQVRNVSARFPVFITDATADGDFGRNGILTMNINSFLRIFPIDTFTVP